MKNLRLEHLIQAHKIVRPLMTPEFIAAKVTFDAEPNETTVPYVSYRFSIAGYGNGAVDISRDAGKHSAVFSHITLGDTIRYSAFYKSRHSNRELIHLLDTILILKLRPFIVAEYPEFFN
jgi:hypothetical protein